MTALATSKRPASGAAVVESGQEHVPREEDGEVPMTPTTAAVIAVSGAVSLRSPRVLSMNGAPAKMKRTTAGR
jgi:hypothetical protein